MLTGFKWVIGVIVFFLAAGLLSSVALFAVCAFLYRLVAEHSLATEEEVAALGGAVRWERIDLSRKPARPPLPPTRWIPPSSRTRPTTRAATWSTTA